jgi:hypothetical protein
MNTPYFKITRFAGNNDNISGLVSAAAPIGAPVRVAKASSAVAGLSDSGTKIEAHAGNFGRLYFLTRRVVSEPSALERYEPTEDVYPFVVGGQASAVAAEEIEAEGGNAANDGLANYLHSGIDSNTAVGTLLTIVNGQWKIRDTPATQAVCGRFIGLLAPAYPGNTRAAIEVLEPRLDKVE